METISWHLKERGCENFEVLEREYDTKVRPRGYAIYEIVQSRCDFCCRNIMPLLFHFFIVPAEFKSRAIPEKIELYKFGAKRGKQRHPHPTARALAGQRVDRRSRGSG